MIHLHIYSCFFHAKKSRWLFDCQVKFPESIMFTVEHPHEYYIIQDIISIYTVNIIYIFLTCVETTMIFLSKKDLLTTGLLWCRNYSIFQDLSGIFRLQNFSFPWISGFIPVPSTMVFFYHLDKVLVIWGDLCPVFPADVGELQTLEILGIYGRKRRWPGHGRFFSGKPHDWLVVLTCLNHLEKYE